MKINSLSNIVLLVAALCFPIASVAANKIKMAPSKKTASGRPVLSKAPPATTNLVNLIENNEIAKPKQLAELNGIDSMTSSYSVEEAIKLGFVFGPTYQTQDRRFFVKNFIHYKEFEKDGSKVRYGVGIRWVVNFKVGQIGANYNGFPFIAAAATFNTAETSSRFQVIGLNNPKITELVANASDKLNLDTYGDAYATFIRIVDLIDDPKTVLNPELVSMTVFESDIETEYSEALAKIWAIQKIAEAKTFEQATSSFPDASLADIEIIRKAYMLMAAGDSQSKPSGVAIERAKEILKGLKIKR